MTLSNATVISDDGNVPKHLLDPIGLAGELTRSNARGSVVITMSKLVKLKGDVLQKFAETANEWGQKLEQKRPQMSSELDELADNLVRTLSDAMITSGLRSMGQSGRSSPWWSDECRQARKLHKSLGDKDSKKAFRRTVANAKRQFWQRKFAKAQSDIDLYRILQQAEPWPQANLQISNGLQTNYGQSNTLVEDKTAIRSISGHNSQQYREPVTNPLVQPLALAMEITLEEAKWAAISCMENSPDADKITLQFLHAAWPVIGYTVKLLYESSLQLKHVPAIFKLAEVILFPRPRRDLSTPNEWRPITLLWYLGEGLERMIVKQMSYSSLVYQAYHQQQPSVLPTESTPYPVAGLIPYMERTKLSN
ncbi:hypothetical protein K3495_g10308 [Podosphaera aphanis]|nr:hypothetical protein K3495_g10308 [Podosphaera aphanis]